MLVEDIRKQFPILNENVYGKPLVYLDNAATSQRPLSVICKMEEMMTKSNANIHRAVHKLSDLSTSEFESTREAVRDFIGANSSKEIIFTSGATASLNLAAFCVGESLINKGDKILICEAEHHSNIVPWQMMALRRGAEIVPFRVNDNGTLDLELLEATLKNKHFKLFSVTQISNVLGVRNPIKQIVNICHSNDCLVCVDGSQGVVHEKVNVEDLGCDFYAFSGHKIYAATGTGVLYIKKSLADILPPYMGGGEMIDTVSFEGTTYAGSPQKFEAGTQNFNAVPTLKPAFEFVQSVREPDIEAYQNSIADYVYDALQDIEGIKVFGTGESVSDKIPLFSFTVEGAHHEDLALIMDKMGIALRSGMMCAEPLMRRFGVTGMLRASFAPYNTKQEAQYFVECLQKAIGMLR